MFTFQKFDFLTDGYLELYIQRKAHAHEERFQVPAYYFSIKKSGFADEIGKIEIRIGHNEQTFYGGNVGYEIYPPYRGNHYAMRACQIIKRVAKGHGMKFLYISCLPDNIASNKTCQRLGAKLLGNYLIPFHNEMYLMGIPQINIYVLEVR